MTTNSEEEDIFEKLFNEQLNNTNKFERDKGIEVIRNLLLNNEKHLKTFRDKILELIDYDQLNWIFR